MYNKFFDFYDIGVELVTDNAEFLEFAGQYLQSHEGRSQVRIRSTVRFPSAPGGEAVSPSIPEEMRGGRQLGYHARFTENSFLDIQPNGFRLEMTVNREAKVFEVLCVETQWPQRGKRFWRTPRPNLHRFQQILRLAVHYPLFWLLERERRVFVLHGSAVEIGGDGVMFVGLAGVGKSTLALALTAMGHSRFLTDNFLLYDDERVLPFLEMVRVAPGIAPLLGDRSILDLSSLSIRERSYFNIPGHMAGSPVRPNRAFLVVLSDKTEVEPISREQFADIALRLGEYVKEFHNSAYPALLPILWPEEHPVYPSRYENLLSLLGNASCYVLSIERDQELTQQWKKLEALI